MRAGLFLAYWPWFTPDEQVELAVLADELGLDSVWVSEAWGQDAVSVLGLLAGRPERAALGSGRFQIPGPEQDARVRRDRPRRAGPQDARARGPRVPRPAGRREAAEAARQAGPEADPGLPRRRRPEGRRAGRRDRRRLAAVHAEPRARRDAA